MKSSEKEGVNLLAAQRMRAHTHARMHARVHIKCILKLCGEVEQQS